MKNNLPCEKTAFFIYLRLFLEREKIRHPKSSGTMNDNFARVHLHKTGPLAQ